MNKVIKRNCFLLVLVVLHWIYCRMGGHYTHKSLKKDGVFAAIFITLYTLYFYMGGDEFMNNSIGTIPGLPKSGIFASDPQSDAHVSGWSISHYLLYTALAYKYDCYVFLFLFGIVWEIFESSLGRLLSAYGIRLGTLDNSQSHYSKQWFVGNYADIIWNTLGIMTGILIKTYL